MAFTLTIGGVNRTTKLVYNGRIRYSNVAGQRGRFELAVLDLLGATAYRPAPDDTVKFEDGATTLFEGRILGTRESPAQSAELDYTTTETVISGSDQTAYLDQPRVKLDIAAGVSLKTALTSIRDNWLTGYGITIDAAMASGPTLPAIVADKITAAEAIALLSKITGWIRRLTGGKVLSMFSPGSVAAPYNLSDAGGDVMGIVEWSKDRKDYWNQILVRCGNQGGKVFHEQTWVATAGQTAFVLDYPMADIAAYGYVDVDTTGLGTGYVANPLNALGAHGTFTVSVATDAFTGDPVYTLTTTSARSVGHLVRFKYDRTSPFTVYARDAGQIASKGLYELLVDRADIDDKTQAQALADGLLRYYLASTSKVVQVTTRKAGVPYPGQSLTLSFAARDVSGTFMVIGVEFHDDVDRTLVCTLTCVEGTEATPTWLDFFRDLEGGGASSAGTVAVSGPLLLPQGSSFGDDVVSNAGEDHLTDGAEVSLRGNMNNASFTGPCIRAGRLDAATAWAIGANMLNPSPLRRGLAFIPLARSSTIRWAMALSQDPGGSGVDDEYYLIPSPNGGKLTLGSNSSPPTYRIEDIHTKNCHSYGVYFEASRTVGMGKRQARTFAAGNFTADTGTHWTVASGDVLADSASEMGDEMEMQFYIQTSTVSNTPSYLKIAIPNSRTVGLTTCVPCIAFYGGKWNHATVYAGAGDAFIRLYRSTAPVDNAAVPLTSVGGLPTFTQLWPNETDLIYVLGRIRFYTA